MQVISLQDDFRTFTQPAVDVRVDTSDLGEGLDLKAIIGDDLSFQNTQRGIRDIVSRSYDNIYDFSGVFSTFLRMYLENLNTDFGSLPPDVLTLDYFRSAITKFKLQIEEMKKYYSIWNNNIILTL